MEISRFLHLVFLIDFYTQHFENESRGDPPAGSTPHAPPYRRHLHDLLPRCAPRVCVSGETAGIHTTFCPGALPVSVSQARPQASTRPSAQVRSPCLCLRGDRRHPHDLLTRCAPLSVSQGRPQASTRPSDQVHMIHHSIILVRL